MKITEIQGIGNAMATKLLDAGVRTTDSLLKKGSTKKDRETISEACGISEKKILAWVNRADLCRIKGVGEEYSDLLECAGVDTVPELAQRNPENLRAAMITLNEKKNLVRAVPAPRSVKSWVAQAKKLPRVVDY